MHICIDSLPRRPDHNLTDLSFQISIPPRLLFRFLFRSKPCLGAVMGSPWAVLRRSWVLLGRSWAIQGVLGVLGPILGALGVLSGGLGTLLGALGCSCAVLGRSKVDQQIDPKLDSKTGQIATEKNGPNTTPVVVSELDKPQRKTDAATLKSLSLIHI